MRSLKSAAKTTAILIGIGIALYYLPDVMRKIFALFFPLLGLGIASVVIIVIIAVILRNKVKE